MDRAKKILNVLLLLFFIHFESVNCACKLHDASWETGKGPIITQPSKSDPSKVKVDWGSIIKNARCVDEYNLFLWKKNTPKENAQKLPISNKGTVSSIAEVEACVEYNFVMEYVENDIFRTDRKESLASIFRTEAVPHLRSTDKKNFRVGYYFDKEKGINDLTKVSIKFPKKILDHASCIKHLEISGQINKNVPSTPAQRPNILQGLNIVNAELLYPDHNHQHGWHGKGEYNQATAPVRNKRNIFKSATTTTTTTTTTAAPSTKVSSITSAGTTTASPVIAQAPAPAAATAGGSLTVHVAPPFLFDSIEAIVEGVEPCKPYIFNLKVYSPQGSVLGEISGLELPPLSEIEDYHPPPMSKLFYIDFTSSLPAIKLRPGLGVPMTCLPTFLESVDRHMQRLEEDVTFHVAQELNADSKVKYFKQELTQSHTSNLKLLGCKCQSPTVNLTSGDASVIGKFPNTFGMFHFDGIHQGKPFYRSISRHLAYEPNNLANRSENKVANGRMKREVVKRIPCSSSEEQQPESDESSSQESNEVQYKHKSTAMKHPPGSGNLFAKSRTKRFVGKLLSGSDVSTSTTSPPSQTNGATTKSPVESQPPNSDFSDLQSAVRMESLSAAASPPQKVLFLFWEPSDKSWVVSEALGGGKPLFKSQKTSRALCPADPENLKSWTYSSTLQWKNDPTLKFDCSNL